MNANGSRPGRPPKRTQSVTSPENPHIMPHSVPWPNVSRHDPSNRTLASGDLCFQLWREFEVTDCLHNSVQACYCELQCSKAKVREYQKAPMRHSFEQHLICLTAAAAAAANAAIAEAMKVKKIKLEAMSSYHSNANHHGGDGENGDLSSSVGLELPFMMMPHPLIPVSLPPASVTMAMSQMNHLSTIANMAAAAQGQSLPSRMVTSVIKGLQERVPDSPSPAPSLEDHRRPGSHPSSHRSSSVSSSPAHTESSSDRIPIHHNGLSMNHALLGLSPNIPPGPKEGDLAHDMSYEAATHKRIHADKVAIDNARAQEKQVQLEKTELKMELFRERELRETLEKQLAMEQKNRAIIQKRLKKEKKAKRKLQEALEYESKRREQVEQTLKQPSPSDSMRSLNDSLTPEMESDRSTGRTDAERTIQGPLEMTPDAVMSDKYVNKFLELKMPRRDASFNVNIVVQKGLRTRWREVEAEPDVIHAGL
ncbi:unnamed protein product [Tetraodon nigroviridis]|uniref:(spotted green pufferfish) hypothetical protein n=1 Tax=Tetraodon nigroviridis TaxID=99883 RepID=Q4RWD1_TETNG|nr:unnamed protein product [Tetraodon nigroviridis]